jgi:hypothetical protein
VPVGHVLTTPTVGDRDPNERIVHSPRTDGYPSTGELNAAAETTLQS